MCFSAEVSLATAALLIPVGIVCLKTSIKINKSYWAFALFPFMFGVQQLMEGIVWLGLGGNYENLILPATFVFLFFSHLFWLTWVPFSSYLTETNTIKRRLFIVITIVGVLFGMSMYIPLLTQTDWVKVSIQHHSIYYEVKIMHDAYIPRYATTLIYASIILFPLLFSSDRYHKVLGILLMVSGIVSWAFLGLVFISVWCFFAAIISFYIFYQVVLTKHNLPSV